MEDIWAFRRVVPELIESQRRWLRYHGVSFLSILIREAPPGSTKGEHAHQLVHVPNRRQADFLWHTKHFLGGNRRLPKRALAWTHDPQRWQAGLGLYAVACLRDCGRRNRKAVSVAVVASIGSSSASHRTNGIGLRGLSVHENAPQALGNSGDDRSRAIIVDRRAGLAGQHDRLREG